MYTRYAYANTRTKRFFFFSFSLSGILLKRRNSAIKSSLEWSSRAPLGSLAKTKVGSSRLCSRAKSLLYSHRDAYKRPVVNVSHAVIISGEKTFSFSNGNRRSFSQRKLHPTQTFPTQTWLFAPTNVYTVCTLQTDRVPSSNNEPIERTCN